MILLRVAFVCAFYFFIIQPARVACAQSPLPAQGMVYREKLPSGLRLIVAPRKGGLVALDLWVRVGSASETTATNGLAHFIEHLVFKGSMERPPGALDAAVESLGGELSARTSRAVTRYETVCPRENWRKILALMAETTLHPAFRPADIEQERSVVAREMATAETEPLRQGFALLMGAAYAPPSGEESQSLPLMGSAANVARFGPEDLRTFWETWYRPDTMTLVVTGDVDTGEVAQAARDLFPAASVPRVPSLEPATPPSAPPTGVVRAPIPPAQIGREIATVLMGFRVSPVEEKANVAPAIDILIPLLAGGAESRLTHALREEKGIYAVRADYQTIARGGSGLIFIAVTGKAANVEEMENAVVTQMERLREEPITDDEVEAARRMALGQRKYEVETVNGWAQQLAEDDLWARGDDYDKKLAMVVPEAVREAVARYLTAYRYTLAVVGATNTRVSEKPSAGESAR